MSECDCHHACACREAQFLRAVEAAYRLGAKDALRLCAGEAKRVMDGFVQAASVAPSSDLWGERMDQSRGATAVGDALAGIDPTRAMPALFVLLAPMDGDSTPIP